MSPEIKGRKNNSINICSVIFFVFKQGHWGKFKFAELYVFTNSSVLDNRGANSGRQLSRQLTFQMCIDLSHCDDGADPYPV